MVSRLFQMFMFNRSKSHETLIVQCTSVDNGNDPSKANRTSSRSIVSSRKEFLRLAKDWWDSRGTNFNDFDEFHALNLEKWNEKRRDGVHFEIAWRKINPSQTVLRH